MRAIIWVALFFYMLLLLWAAAAHAEPAAPTQIAIVACRVDDLTGKPGRHDPEMAARNWRDLELHISNGEYSCKHEVLALEDAAPYSPLATEKMIPLEPNWGDWSQCSSVGAVQAQMWNDRHKGWATIAVGCPTPIVDLSSGKIIGWKLPGCPTYLPGTQNRMRCRFDASLI